MSKKRKKKSPLRNEFTDALNVEMAERKISEKVQAAESQQATADSQQETVEITAASVETVSVENISTPKIEIEKISVEEIPAKVETPKIETAKVETTKTEIAKIEIAKVETPKTKLKKTKSSKTKSAKTENPKIEIVEVKTDPKLEKRIFKEADDTLFEEKPPVSESKKFAYRSKAMKRWEEEREEKSAPTFEPVPKVETPRPLSRPEKFGGVVSVVMLVYAFVNFDKPLFFLALSLFAHFLSQPLGAVFGKHAHAVQNAIHSFSIVIFFGAIMFLFTD